MGERSVLRGIPASPGVAVGHAVVIDAHHHRARHFHIDDDEVNYQSERLRTAIERSRGELQNVRDRLGLDAPEEYRLILDAHLMMHRDELLVETAMDAIDKHRINAEWAVERAVKHAAEKLKRATNDYIRDRAVDVENVGQRILAQLLGRVSSMPSMLKGSVLVMDDLHPTDAVHMIEQPVAALVTNLGSATSHTAILARTLGIPAVVGVEGATEQVGTGDELVVDALRGEVIIGPDDAEREQAGARGRRYHVFTDRLRDAAPLHSRTRDDVEIVLRANVDLLADAQQARDAQAKGVGLYRTEFLLMNREEAPSEDEQAQAYMQLAAAVAPDPLTVRSFDLGGDVLTEQRGQERAPNPALGVRGIRYLLAHPEIFETQLRAVLRAAAVGPVRLMFPMIAGIEELRLARAALGRAQDALKARKVPFGTPEVGVMIELPSAAMLAEPLARECDFLSVGTNDLMQYTLAVDRTNPDVAYLADPVNPGVLRLLDAIAKAGRVCGKPVAMCGDMASDLFGLPVVIGLAYRELSVPVSALPLVREVLHRLDTAQAADVAREALGCATAHEVRRLVASHFGEALGEVWAESGLAPS